jgi:hypothetical protein
MLTKLENKPSKILLKSFGEDSKYSVKSSIKITTMSQFSI